MLFVLSRGFGEPCEAEVNHLVFHRWWTFSLWNLMAILMLRVGFRVHDKLVYQWEITGSVILMLGCFQQGLPFFIIQLRFCRWKPFASLPLFWAKDQGMFWHNQELLRGVWWVMCSMRKQRWWCVPKVEHFGTGLAAVSSNTCHQLSACCPGAFLQGIHGFKGTGWARRWVDMCLRYLSERQSNIWKTGPDHTCFEHRTTWQPHGMDFQGQGEQLNLLVFRPFTGLLANLGWKAGSLPTSKWSCLSSCVTRRDFY